MNKHSEFIRKNGPIWLVKDAADEIDRLERELDNERVQNIHSCSPHCSRPMCRKLRALEQAIRDALEYCESVDNCYPNNPLLESAIAELRDALKEVNDEP